MDAGNERTEGTRLVGERPADYDKLLAFDALGRELSAVA